MPVRASSYQRIYACDYDIKCPLQQAISQYASLCIQIRMPPLPAGNTPASARSRHGPLAWCS